MSAALFFEFPRAEHLCVRNFNTVDNQADAKDQFTHQQFLVYTVTVAKGIAVQKNIP